MVTQVDQGVAVSEMTTRAGEQQDLKIKYLPSGEALDVGMLHTAVWQECAARATRAVSIVHECECVSVCLCDGWSMYGPSHRGCTSASACAAKGVCKSKGACKGVLGGQMQEGVCVCVSECKCGDGSQCWV